MAADEIVHSVPYDYQLLRRAGRLWLSVECGRSAVFTLTFPLTEAEAKRVADEGVAFAGVLAGRVQSNPDRYASRVP